MPVQVTTKLPLVAYERMELKRCVDGGPGDPPYDSSEIHSKQCRLPCATTQANRSLAMQRVGGTIFTLKMRLPLADSRRLSFSRKLWTVVQALVRSEELERL
jgi:hypothetical protein